jgi:hypothetical protein
MVKAKVYYEGTPAPEAQVVFHRIEGDRMIRTADGVVEADGSLELTTYKAFDGAPAGSYAVTVVRREPARDSDGQPGSNRLPGKYANPATSGLRVEVKAGDNDLRLNLTR